MAKSKLVRNVGKAVFGTAVAGFGFSLGRDTYKKTKKTGANNTGAILLFGLVLLLVVGAIYLPYKGASKLTQWYPFSPIKWFFLVFIPWSLTAFIGILMAWYVGQIFYLSAADITEQYDNLAVFRETSHYDDYLSWLGFFLLCNIGFGVWIGSLRREKGKKAYETEAYNQKFLDNQGIIEVDGAQSYTHKDRSGNKLRLTSIGKDVVEFFVVGRRNKRAFIRLDDEGKFQSYSGIVKI